MKTIKTPITPTQKRARSVDKRIDTETRAIVGQELQRDMDRSLKAAIAAVSEHFKRSRQVEDLISKGAGDPVADALQTLLVELSCEARVSFLHPRVAALFYRVALDEARAIQDPRPPLQTCLRHLAILLNNPDAKTARKITTFWNDHGDPANSPERDPFPATPAKRSQKKGGAR